VTLLLIGLVGGVITGLSPCVLPVLPVVLLGGGAGPEAESDPESTRRRPYLVVFGLTVSFALFTLFGTLVLNALHLPDDTIRWVGLALLVLVGLGLLLPALGHLLERPFARFPQRLPHANRNGFVLGIALGAVFVPCAGPVLAAITVAGATGHIDRRTLELTLGFAIGTAIPLLFFALAGRGMSQRLQAFRRHQRAFRAVSGVVMIALAVALTFNLADVIQRDVPDYTQAIGNHLEKDASQVSSAGGSASLENCQSAALYGGEGLQECGAAPGFKGIEQWFNTPGDKPLTMTSLRGKVVLVDFWAYSCINCQRELVHVEAWAKDYARAGLVVVGVQTPEYAFEHVPSNVLAGAHRLGLTFPIALDDSYATWNAYDNQSWPADYLVDATGKIRHVSIGEGDYTQEEDLIRELLTSAHPGTALPAPTSVPDLTPTDGDQSPETYLGSDREQYYDGSTSYKNGTRRFTPVAGVASDSYTLGGTWTVAAQSITAGSGAQVTLAYHASEVYLDVGGTGTLTVSGAAAGSTRVIQVSGAPDIYTVASSAAATTGTVTVRLSPGLSAYSFTFG
jgi:cytochrome c biogenesis protein CcdA/thiol-disulfide isomerase/thioredoxin